MIQRAQIGVVRIKNALRRIRKLVGRTPTGGCLLNDESEVVLAIDPELKCVVELIGVIDITGGSGRCRVVARATRLS